MYISSPIESLSNKARTRKSSDCINDCQSLCCRKGSLIATKEEAQTITHDKLDEHLQEERVKSLPDGTFSIDLNQTCPSLVNGLCSIHKDPLRPSTCHKFPIFIFEDSKTIQLSSRCPAVREGKFYVFEHEAKKKGYTLQ